MSCVKLVWMFFPVFLCLLRSSSIKYPVCYILVSSFLAPRLRPPVPAPRLRPPVPAPRLRPPVPAPRLRPPVPAPRQHPPVAAPRKLTHASPLVPSGSPSFPLVPSSSALPERPRDAALPERPRDSALPERPPVPDPRQRPPVPVLASLLQCRPRPALQSPCRLRPALQSPCRFRPAHQSPCRLRPAHQSPCRLRPAHQNPERRRLLSTPLRRVSPRIFFGGATHHGGLPSSPIRHGLPRPPIRHGLPSPRIRPGGHLSGLQVLEASRAPTPPPLSMSYGAGRAYWKGGGGVMSDFVFLCLCFLTHIWSFLFPSHY